MFGFHGNAFGALVGWYVCAVCDICKLSFGVFGSMLEFTVGCAGSFVVHFLVFCSQLCDFVIG